MTRILIFVVAFTIILFSCSNNDNSISGCGLENPKEELAWLKGRIDSMQVDTSEWAKYCYVVQGEYKKRTVFRFEDCNPAINKIVFTLNCDGSRIDSHDDPIFSTDLKNQKIIWKPLDFACQVSF